MDIKPLDSSISPPRDVAETDYIGESKSTELINHLPQDTQLRAVSKGYVSVAGKSDGSEARTSEDISEKTSSDLSADVKKGDLPRQSDEESITPRHDRHDYPGPAALALLTVGICLAVFLVSLDRTIVTTAIPTIANDFHSYSDVGWYGSAYLLTSSAFQPTFGRIYDMFRVKWTYLTSLLIFEIGSVVCATASTSLQLIIGRAITGLGSAGMLTGSFVIAAQNVSLRQRPIYIALVGTIYSLGAIAGPLLGGVFTTLLTWRWCFWLNLPIGGLTILTVFFVIKSRKEINSEQPLNEKFIQLDPVSNLLFLGATIMFFYALQQKNDGLSWNSATIIGLLVGAGVSCTLFIVWQWWRGEKALMPPSVVCQRSVAAGVVSAFFIYATLLTQTYYLPIWFQSIKAQSAIQSGVDMIPYIASAAVATLFAGAVVGKVGYFGPPSIIGCGIGTIGSGLLCTLQIETAPAHWIGYMVLTGIGIGFAVQQGFTAVQTALPMSKVAIGTAAITTAQSLGGAIFVSVSDTILLEDLMQAHVPGVDVESVVTAGPTMFTMLVPPQRLPELMFAYNFALRKVFIAATVLCGLAFLASLAFEQRSSVKDSRAPGADVQDSAEAGRSPGRDAPGSSKENVTSARRPMKIWTIGDDGHWFSESDKADGLSVASPTR